MTRRLLQYFSWRKGLHVSRLQVAMNRGRENKRQHRGAQQPANHGNSEGLQHLRTRAEREGLAATIPQ